MGIAGEKTGEGVAGETTGEEVAGEKTGEGVERTTEVGVVKATTAVLSIPSLLLFIIKSVNNYSTCYFDTQCFI